MKLLNGTTTGYCSMSLNSSLLACMLCCCYQSALSIRHLILTQKKQRKSECTDRRKAKLLPGKAKWNSLYLKSFAVDGYGETWHFGQDCSEEIINVVKVDERLNMDFFL